MFLGMHMSGRVFPTDGFYTKTITKKFVYQLQVLSCSINFNPVNEHLLFIFEMQLFMVICEPQKVRKPVKNVM